MRYHFSFKLFMFVMLSYREIDENALEQALSAAVTCTILAGAGPQRSRVLATLYKVTPSPCELLIECILFCVPYL